MLWLSKQFRLKTKWKSVWLSTVAWHKKNSELLNSKAVYLNKLIIGNIKNIESKFS